jgi:hypothetical protein
LEVNKAEDFCARPSIERPVLDRNLGKLDRLGGNHRIEHGPIEGIEKSDGRALHLQIRWD